MGLPENRVPLNEIEIISFLIQTAISVKPLFLKKPEPLTNA